MAIHLGCPLPDTSSRPTRAAARKPASGIHHMPPLFGLAPGGVYPAIAVADDAVRSYRTLSPLPRLTTGGLLSVALSLGSPPPAINRHRVSMEPGLSSPRRVSLLPKGGHPTVWTVYKVGRKPFPVKWLWTRQRRWPLRFLDPDHPIRCPERTGAETPSTLL